ncbi:MAG: formate--tetrahydrofolate ligase [Planctomycetota bacterium]
MPSDLEIARQTPMKPIQDIARASGILDDEVELYGKTKAKISLSILDRLAQRPNGKYIVITAITPTPLGEGKTVNTIGLSLGLNHIGKKVFTCIRQPSLGPVFGVKGGAAGGGYSQVLPMEDFNLHLTGDVHAVSIANNLLAAAIDTSLLLKNPLGIDPSTITWKRVVDVNDRALRQIITGLGGTENGVPRETGFDIAVASEVMAVLALAQDLKDLRARLGRMVVASTYDGKPVTAEDLKAAGSLAVLLKDALMPNLLQTTEHTPVFVHAGPFANIAHGNSSILADRMALKLADYVVTESGFGADMGCEKFFNIKSRVSGLTPSAAGLVMTIRGLKLHGLKVKITPGKPLPPELTQENLEALRAGAANLRKQIENVRAHGIPVVAALNRMAHDTDAEVAEALKLAKEFGASDAVVSEVWAKGGAGGADFARAIVKAAEGPSSFKKLYEDSLPVRDKIKAIATKIYGAKDVSYSPEADKALKRIEKWGYGNLAVCMAKTQYSISHDPALRGAPTGFTLPVQDVRLSAGAGFVVPLLGEMKTMPGLGSTPGMHYVDIDGEGRIQGLF